MPDWAEAGVVNNQGNRMTVDELSEPLRQGMGADGGLPRRTGIHEDL